jgi:hypothetical protein
LPLVSKQLVAESSRDPNERVLDQHSESALDGHACQRDLRLAFLQLVPAADQLCQSTGILRSQPVVLAENLGESSPFRNRGLAEILIGFGSNRFNLFGWIFAGFSHLKNS